MVRWLEQWKSVHPTLDMASEGLRWCFKGDFADTCTIRFPLKSIGGKATPSSARRRGEMTHIHIGENCSFISTVKLECYLTILFITLNKILKHSVRLFTRYLFKKMREKHNYVISNHPRNIKYRSQFQNQYNFISSKMICFNNTSI